MDRRQTAFWITAAIVWFGWMFFYQVMYPPKKKLPPPNAQVAQKDEVKDAKGNVLPAKQDPPSPAASLPVEKPVTDEKAVAPVNDLTLGTPDVGPKSKYETYARLTNVGAAVTYLQLNRFKNEHRNGPMVLIPEMSSFQLQIKGDPGVGLNNKNWEVVEQNEDKVVFRTTALEGRLEVDKAFSLKPDSPMIELGVTLRNRATAPMKDVVYKMQGASGLPIEGSWYTSYYRHLVAVLLPTNGRSPYLVQQDANTIVNNEMADPPTPQRYSEFPIQFAGIVDQYFGSLMIQKDMALEKRQIAMAEPLLVAKTEKPAASDISVIIDSVPLTIEPGQEVTHTYLLYNGPKDAPILAEYSQYELPLLIHYYDFLNVIPIGSIAKLMVFILGILYTFTHDYGVAIILLTIIVRLAMFPLSYKQAHSMQKMMLLQPKLQEIKDKHGNDKERYNREMMELYSKHKVNPMGGCLPMLIQMPIFIGLYQALSNSFALRQSTFLYGWTWIHDLAAPDQLFPFGFDVPWLGPYFNLLPLIAMTQMIIQMKVMSPPPTTQEAALQQKMMTYMMVFMGFLFYKVPSGLCIYIITTGTWSILERRFLPKKDMPAAKPTVIDTKGVVRDESTWKKKKK